MTDPVEPKSIIQISDFIGAGIGFIGVLVGSWVANNSAKRLAKTRSKQSITTGLFDEFHSDSMNKWRSKAYSALTSKTGQSFQSAFDASTPDEKKAISMFFHYLEKIAALKDADLVDKELLSNILGRYLEYWFSEVIEKLSPDPPGSEWTGMLEKIQKLKAIKSAG